MNKDIKTEEFLIEIYDMAKRRKTEEEIVGLLEGKYCYSRENLDKLFLKKFKMTLICYIKKMRLICAYEYWCANGCKSISEKESVFWLPQFKRKFKECFSYSPEEAYEKNVDLKSVLPNGELYKALSDSSIFEDFKIESKGIKIVLNEFNTLLFLMDQPVYKIPQLLWDKCQAEEDPLTRKLLIIASTRYYEEKKSENDNWISQPIEYVQEDLERLELYDVDNPILLGGMLFFHMKGFDKVFSTFKDKINEIIPFLYADDFGLWQMNDFYLSSYNYLKKYSLTMNVNIKLIAEYLDISVDETLNELWIRTKAGLLCYGEERYPESIYYNRNQD
ncbi:hypothetical protein D6853_05770 [Butyrivibrio sp. X503]|uniref:hypothetical protein n=1 Tax=Butyrivibrio sp. X503 TaxID=2364878 RepID=UPI000EA947BA|nr:hypothetical protein [Butyrivibrio sp. X503]RKM56302.1 hypothetical protein D6853_05770 [Butyrivibrio sp. X503]